MFARLKPQYGFTLAELLVTLLIIGQIVTFTIPKIISSQQNTSSNAKAKEAAGMLSGAMQQLQFSGALNANTSAGAFTQYLNYVKYDTSGATIDDVPSYLNYTCNATSPCLRLHSGAVILYGASSTFGGTAPTNYMDFIVDPDGSYSGSSSGNGKSVKFSLYYNGRLTTMGVQQGNSALDPTWFQW